MAGSSRLCLCERKVEVNRVGRCSQDRPAACPLRPREHVLAVVRRDVM
jgi:hypothetical protein